MPNLPVDVISWGRLACYPRGSFYPLSDGHSTMYRRITKSCFRTCSTCKSCSQPHFYLCALHMVSDHIECSFERLRYSLGGDRPSQTTHHALVSFPDKGNGLENQFSKGGISRLTPLELASQLQSLPPILHMLNQFSIRSYSKAPRGLFVLMRVTSVFTGTIISPSPMLRQ